MSVCVQVDALMKSLLQQRAEDPTIKSVVVSQFTSFLTLLEKPLRSSYIAYAVYYMYTSVSYTHLTLPTNREV